MVIKYFIGAILSKKSCQKQGVGKKQKKGDSHIVGVVQKKGF